MDTKFERALEVFNNGYNCSQSVLAVFCEDYGFDKDLALKLSCGFGGGVRSGEICGAVTGAVFVIGLKNGHCVLGDTKTKDNCYKKTTEFLEAFTSINKSTVCRELLGFDIRNNEDKLKYNDRQKTICPRMIESAIKILEETGY